jgi:hypothetical protein
MATLVHLHMSEIHRPQCCYLNFHLTYSLPRDSTSCRISTR